MRVITDQKAPQRVFQIVDAVHDDPMHPFRLLDETDTIVIVGSSPRQLADYGLENGADVVRHSYNIVAYEASR